MKDHLLTWAVMAPLVFSVFCPQTAAAPPDSATVVVTVIWDISRSCASMPPVDIEAFNPIMEAVGALSGWFCIAPIRVDSDQPVCKRFLSCPQDSVHGLLHETIAIKRRNDVRRQEYTSVKSQLKEAMREILAQPRTDTLSDVAGCINRLDLLLSDPEFRGIPAYTLVVSDLIGNTGRNIKHIPNSIFLVVGADPQRAKAMLGNVIVFESIDSALRYLLRKLVASAPDAELDNRQASGNATME